MPAKKTTRQMQLDRAAKKLQIRAKIERNKEDAKRKQLENRKLREELRSI